MRSIEDIHEEIFAHVAKLPIDSTIAAACDAGKVEDIVVYEVMDAVNAALSCPKKEIQ